MIFNIRLIMNLFVLGFLMMEDNDEGLGRLIGKFFIIVGVICNIISVFNGG